MPPIKIGYGKTADGNRLTSSIVFTLSVWLAGRSTDVSSIEVLRGSKISLRKVSSSI